MESNDFIREVGQWLDAKRIRYTDVYCISKQGIAQIEMIGTPARCATILRAAGAIVIDEGTQDYLDDVPIALLQFRLPDDNPDAQPEPPAAPDFLFAAPPQWVRMGDTVINMQHVMYVGIERRYLGDFDASMRQDVLVVRIFEDYSLASPLTEPGARWLAEYFGLQIEDKS
jgi:hypothetical protein